MKMELTALILSQAKTFAVMLAAGALTETLWQAKRILQKCITAAGLGKGKLKKNMRAAGFLPEIVFWAAVAAVITGFLYYCSYGKPSLHAVAGFFIGLLLWKKLLSYVILFP